MPHVFTLFSLQNILTLDMIVAFSAIRDRLHFHFDTRNLTSNILPLPLGTRRLDSAIDRNESVINCSMAE